MKFNLDKWKSRKEKKSAIQERTQERYETLKRNLLDDFGVTHEGELSEGKHKLFIDMLKERWAVARTSQYHIDSPVVQTFKRYGNQNVNHKDIVKIKPLGTDQVQYMRVEFTEPGYVTLQPVLPTKNSWEIDRVLYPQTMREQEFSKLIKSGDYLVVDNWVHADKRQYPILENDIKNDAQFKEYAEKLLKKAHGDNYDQSIADETIKGIIDKYDDYGAMVGALQSGLAEQLETVMEYYFAVRDGNKPLYRSYAQKLDELGVDYTIQNQVADLALDESKRAIATEVIQNEIMTILKDNHGDGKSREGGKMLGGLMVENMDIFHCDHQTILGQAVHYLVVFLNDDEVMVHLMKATDGDWEKVEVSEYDEEPLEQKLTFTELEYRIKQEGWVKVDNFGDAEERGFLVKESKIQSDDAFKDYAEKVLKKAHGDNYDQSIVDKMVADLIKKHDGDYGAMVGAFTQGLAESIGLFETKIKSDKEFEDYALKVLKKAHGDNFDQKIADDTIKGIKQKYSKDYGAMVGALQSGLAEAINLNEKKVQNIDDFKVYSEKVLNRAHGENYDQSIVDKMVDDLNTDYDGDVGAMVGAINRGLVESAQIETPKSRIKVSESYGNTIYTFAISSESLGDFAKKITQDDSLFDYVSETIGIGTYLETADGYVFAANDVKELLIK